MFGLNSECSQQDDAFAQVPGHEVVQGRAPQAGGGYVRAETPRMFPVRVLALSASLLALALPAGANAASTSFGLKALGAPRGYFVLSGAPGASVRGQIRVVNAGHQTGTVRLLAADATTGRTTGVVYETKGVKAAGTWLAMDRDSVQLAPGRSAVVGFTVHVPSDAGAGDHLGGIVAEPVATRAATPTSKAKHSFHVNVVEQSIVAVQVTVPGPASEELKLTSIRSGGDPGFQTLLVGITNPGQRLVKGSGVVKVLDRSGATLRRQSFAVDTFVPGTKIEDPIVVRGKVLPAGRYEASVIIRWAGGHSTTLHAPFTVDNKQLRQVYGSKGLPSLGGGSGGKGTNMLAIVLGGLLVLLLGIGGTALWFRRRTRELELRHAPRDDGDARFAVTDRRPSPGGEPVGVAPEHDQP